MALAADDVHVGPDAPGGGAGRVDRAVDGPARRRDPPRNRGGSPECLEDLAAQAVGFARHGP